MPDRPNILFIFCDQMRADCMSIVGHPVVETPTLDHIGRQGVVFTGAYSSVPSCIAARACVFTGLAPTNTGRLGYQDQVPWNYENMLARVLGEGGYQTHCVGKTHFYPQRKHCGFQSMESYEGLQNFDGLYVNDYHEWLREQSGGRFREYDHGLSSNSWASRPSPMPEEFHNNSWVATRSIEFLRRRDKTRPFFLFMSFHRPHPPIDPPQAFYDMYEDRDIPEVPVGDWADVHDVTVDHLDAWHGRLPKETLARSRRAYYAQVAHIDNQVGRIIQAMRVLKTGPTAIIFTADHGEMLGDHHLFRKSYAYEGSAAVPLVVSMPGRTGRGHCDAPVISHDVYPTILDVAGVDVPGKIDGRSFLHFADNPSSTDRRDYVHGEHSACYDEDNAMQYLTNGREKFIWFTTTGQEQFFDLVNDPHEKHDLARDPSAKDRIEKWRQRLIDELAPRTQDDLTDGKRLISGVRLPAVRPVLSGDSRQRQEDASEKV